MRTKQIHSAQVYWTETQYGNVWACEYTYGESPYVYQEQIVLYREENGKSLSDAIEAAIHELDLDCQLSDFAIENRDGGVAYWNAPTNTNEDD